MKARLRLSRLTLVVILAGSALLALRAFASFRAAGSAVIAGGPSAVFEQSEQDLGVVPAGEILPVAFAVRNPGSRRLVLSPAGCLSCAHSRGLDPVIVPAGGSAEVIVTLDTTGLSGPVQQVDRYTTSDPQRAQVEFVVTAQVVVPAT
jgi:hypothetical protein